MKKYFLLSALFMLSLGFGFSQTNAVTKADYRTASRFSPTQIQKMVHSTSVSPHWLKESNRFWYSYESSDGMSYYIVDPARKSKTALFDNVKMAADMSRLTGDPFDAQHLYIQKLKFIKNETVLQFEVKSKLAWEEEKKEEDDKEDGDSQEEKKDTKKKKKERRTWHFEYDLNSKTLRLLNDFEKPKEAPSWANIAPDSSFVLFSKEHNLYWMDKENFLKAVEDEKDSTIVDNQWTTDGVEHYSYGRGGRGQTNVDVEKNKDKRKRVFVAWAPGSKKFAMTRTDQREVKDLWVINSIANPRPTLETYKYHMPGEKEAPQVDLLVFDFEAKSQIEVKADTFKDQTINMFYAPRLKKNRDDDFTPLYWMSGSDDHFYFARTSRDLKRIDICLADTKTGEVTTLIEERLNTYVEMQSPGLINNGAEMIHWSEQDGWGHFYLHDKDGNLKNQITSGPFHCDRIESIDEQNRVLYFWANGREEGEDPYYMHLYRINFDGSGLKLLNKANMNHSGSMNDESTYFVNNYSRVDANPKTDLHNNQGTKIMSLETADLSKLMETGYQFPESYTVKADDGITDLYGVMYKPFNFDSTSSYPVILYIYPGPQTEAVNKGFSARMDRLDRMAQLGFVILTVGNRGGHPDRSKWYHNYGYGNLRDYGLADKKTAVEQMADRFDFIDESKVGIFGHSGGGFMSTAAMLVYPDFFKVAVLPLVITTTRFITVGGQKSTTG